MLMIAALGGVVLSDPALAQSSGQPVSAVARYIDPADGLTLEAAVTQALQQEPSLRAVRTEADAAEGRRRQAQLRPNPTSSFGYQKEPGGTDNQTRVEIEWPLDLFRKTGRVAVAEREVDATRQAIADRERRLAGDVRRVYGEVLTAVRDLAVSDDLVAATARQFELVRARADLGATPLLERDMLRVELQRLEAEQRLTTGRAERALIELKRLLGASPDAPLELRQTLEQLVQREVATAVVESEEQRSDVREADARVRVAAAEIDRAQRDGRFDVSVFGMYMRMDAGFPQRGFSDAGGLERVRGMFNYVAAGAMVTLPLRNRNQGEIDAARARRSGAQAHLEAVRLTANAEVSAARARDKAAQEAFSIYSTDARVLARQNLNVVSQTYELGRRTLFDVLTEQRRYLDLERAYTETLREAYEARQALRLALGDVR
jgi:cobalt-zinc-cadmium efflux system outer membrane protein